MKVLLGILAVLVFIGLCIGGWFGYWALQKANTQQQYEVNTGTQQYQSGLISQERDNATAYNAATDPAQKLSIKSQFCSMYADITQIPNDIQSDYLAICQ